MRHMSLIFRIGPFLRHKWPVLALALFYFYLAFHALSGNQGLMRWVDYELDIVRNSAQLEALSEERMRLEAQAARLNPEQIDLDMLDLKARETLFVSYMNEYTIWLDQAP